MVVVRESLNGGWKLDKSRGEPSMRGYLETMGMSELAIVAQEKGEADFDTIHIITLTETTYKIKKNSRVNNLEEEFKIGVETTTPLFQDREKVTMVESSPTQERVCVRTEMPTINGVAAVVDVKTLVEGGSTLRQELTITNRSTGNSHVTERFYVPIDIVLSGNEGECET